MVLKSTDFNKFRFSTLWRVHKSHAGPNGKHICEIYTKACFPPSGCFLCVFKFDDTSNEILLVLRLRRCRASSVFESQCAAARRRWSRDGPSGVGMSVCVTFGACWLGHGFGHFAARSNHMVLVRISGPLRLRAHVFLCLRAHACGMGRGCLDVPSLTCWPVGVHVRLSVVRVCVCVCRRGIRVCEARALRVWTASWVPLSPAAPRLAHGRR